MWQKKVLHGTITKYSTKEKKKRIKALNQILTSHTRKTNFPFDWEQREKDWACECDSVCGFWFWFFWEQSFIEFLFYVET